MEKIFITIDMQNDFISGSLGTPEAVAVVDKIRNKIESNFDDYTAIFFTRDTHGYNYLNTQEGKKLPIEHCLFESAGWAITDRLIGLFYKKKLRPNCLKFINKNHFGTFDWEKYISYPSEIEICGVCTDICVIVNALILKTMFPEARIIVDASCCAGTTPEMHKKALDVMKSCQIEVINE